MEEKLRFLIVDGYPRESREQFDEVGMKLAGVLYRDMLLRYLPDAEYDLWFSSDTPDERPSNDDLANYAGVLWPGCNLTVYHDDDRVKCHLDVARRAFEVGVPGFGSCWGIQVPAYIAGGTVEPHPQGREMGVVRDIRISEAGQSHPMFRDKPPLYSHFVSHDDYITRLPDGCPALAGNAHAPVQAAAIRYLEGEFWGVQYHPEYDLHEMARLIVAREPRLVRQGLFLGHGDLMDYVERLEALHADPARTDLRWQLGIDDSVIDPGIRQREFINWLKYLVLPRAGVENEGGLVNG